MWYDCIDSYCVTGLYCDGDRDCETVYDYYLVNRQRSSDSYGKKQKVSEYNIETSVVMFGSDTTSKDYTMCSHEHLYDFMYSSVRQSSRDDSKSDFTV